MGTVESPEKRVPKKDLEICFCSALKAGRTGPSQTDARHGRAFRLRDLGPEEASASCAPEKLTGEKSMGMSFFALPSIQGPVQGRFKPAHRPISLSARVPACVRRFETPTHLNYGRTESKKDISMFFVVFLSCITLKRHSASSRSTLSSRPKGSWPRGRVGVMC